MKLLSKSPIGGLATLAVASAFLVAVEANAQTETKTQIGVLNCEVAGGVGFILGSSKKLTCVFKKQNGTVEKYEGKVLKVGIDIGVTKKSLITWGVFAPSGIKDEGAIAGRYAGVSAEATVAGGLGANLLVGGKSVTLQPLSVQAQVGLNIAGGIGSIQLNYMGQ